MKNQVNTSEGNVQFIDATGKMINIHPQHVYAVFNVDTVSFVMVGIPKTSGLSILTSTAEDMLFNGEEYTFEELKTVIPEEFAEAGAQARCEIVDELPETGKTNTIYLVPKTEGEGYDEYIYLKDEERWELVGDTSIEMENYLKKVDFAAYSAATDAKIDAISGAVSDEASRAISAESALSDSIDALEDYIDTVSGITDTLDGDIDILEESLAQEASARTDADTVLSGAISSVTEDVAALSGDVTAHTSNTDIHVTAADKIAWADKYTQAEVDGIVSGLNDSIDAVSGAVADEIARAQSAETALHDEIENIDLSDYYTKSETSGATELATAFSGKLDTTAYTPTDLTNYYTKSETSGATELSTAFAAKAELSALTEDERVWAEALTDINGKIGTISGDVDTIEAVLPNKADTSAVTQAVADEATARANADTALSGAVDTALLGYINGAEYVSTAKTINFLHGETVIDSIDATDFIKDGMVSNVEISGGSLVIEFNTDAGTEDIVIPLTDIFDPSNYYTKSQTSGATELTTAFSGIADRIGEDEEVTAAAFVALNDRIGSAETAINGKQNVLVAGENIVISGDVISAEAGNDVTELTQAEYDVLVQAGTVDPDVLYIITDATPINLSNYYQKSETSSKTEITQALQAKANGSDVYLKSETSGATELDAAFSGYVTTDTEQTISGRKIFTYSSDSSKAIEFKQTSDSSKLGFTLRNSADTNNEVASFEFRPNTITIDGVRRPLMYFGHFRNADTAAAGVQQTVIGFRQSDKANQASYHFLMPLPEKAKTPFSLKTSFKDFYAPLGFKVNTGGTMVSADETGVVDLSSYISGGGSSYTAGSGIDITNDVISVTGKVDTSDFNTYSGAVESRLAEDEEVTAAAFVALNDRVDSAETAINGKADTSAVTAVQDSLSGYTTTGETSALSGSVTAHTSDSTIHVTSANKTSWDGAATNASTAITNLGGLKLQQVTQAEYDALVSGGTVDASTLYVIVN